MKTSWKPLGKSLLLIAKCKKWVAEFKRGDDDGWSGCPKEATANENAKALHPLVMCDRRRDLRTIASKVDISFVAVQSILNNILYIGMSKVLQDGCC